MRIAWILSETKGTILGLAMVFLGGLALNLSLSSVCKWNAFQIERFAWRKQNSLFGMIWFFAVIVSLRWYGESSSIQKNPLCFR